MDDDASIRDVIGQMLQRMGYQTKLADDGKLAIKFYSEAMKAGTPFDIIILDLTIPGGMGGAETIKGLLQIDPKIKAIVCSGYSSDPIMSDFRKYGFRAALNKPFQIMDLKRVINQVN